MKLPWTSGQSAPRKARLVVMSSAPAGLCYQMALRGTAGSSARPWCHVRPRLSIETWRGSGNAAKHPISSQGNHERSTWRNGGSDFFLATPTLRFQRIVQDRRRSEFRRDPRRVGLFWLMSRSIFVCLAVRLFNEMGDSSGKRGARQFNPCAMAVTYSRP